VWDGKRDLWRATRLPWLVVPPHPVASRHDWWLLITLVLSSWGTIVRKKGCEGSVRTSAVTGNHNGPSHRPRWLSAVCGGWIAAGQLRAPKAMK